MTSVARSSVTGRAASAALALAVAAAGIGCGYALAGRGNALPPHIQVVGIPPFENETPYPEVEQAVTQGVREEFSSRGQFRVEPGVDGVHAILSGTITSLELQPTALTTGSLQASRYVVTLVARVEFRDQTTDELLWSNPNLRFREEYEVPAEASAGDPTASFRQDTNALERLTRNFARTVVTSILEAF